MIRRFVEGPGARTERTRRRTCTPNDAASPNNNIHMRPGAAAEDRFPQRSGHRRSPWPLTSRARRRRRCRTDGTGRPAAGGGPSVERTGSTSWSTVVDDNTRWSSVAASRFRRSTPPAGTASSPTSLDAPGRSPIETRYSISWTAASISRKLCSGVMRKAGTLRGCSARTKSTRRYTRAHGHGSRKRSVLMDRSCLGKSYLENCISTDHNRCRNVHKRPSSVTPSRYACVLKSVFIIRTVHCSRTYKRNPFEYEARGKFNEASSETFVL